MFMSFSEHVSISDFLLFVKNGFVVGGAFAFSEGNSVSLKQRRSSYEYPHCVSATHRLALDNRPTQLNSPNTYTTRRRPTLNWAAVDSETGRGHGRSEEGWRVGKRKQEAGGREGGNKGSEGGGREGGNKGSEGEGREGGNKERE